LEGIKKLLDVFLSRKRWFPTHYFLKKIPDQKVCCAFWASVLECFPRLIFFKKIKQKETYSATTYQAVGQKDKEREEMLGKMLFDSSFPFP